MGHKLTFGPKSRSAGEPADRTHPAAALGAGPGMDARPPADPVVGLLPLPGAQPVAEKDIAPYLHEREITRCDWCSEKIPWWRLFARLREPPLCSRRCLNQWTDRDL